MFRTFLFVIAPNFKKIQLSINKRTDWKQVGRMDYLYMLQYGWNLINVILKERSHTQKIDVIPLVRGSRNAKLFDGDRGQGSKPDGESFAIVNCHSFTVWEALFQEFLAYSFNLHQMRYYVLFFFPFFQLRKTDNLHKISRFKSCISHLRACNFIFHAKLPLKYAH